MEEKTFSPLSKKFLHLFVREIISHVEPSEIPEPPEKKEINKPTPKHVPSRMMPSAFQIKKPVHIGQALPIIPLTKKKIPGKLGMPITKEMKASPRPNLKSSPFPVPKRGVPPARPAPEAQNLGKLNSLISDPRVRSIECQGPNKNILVHKDGTVQKTSLVLTSDEVENTIKDFSEKTRIPLIGGTFKAALGNLIITAVTSDFVGSRFIIQKKNPFKPLIG